MIIYRGYVVESVEIPLDPWSCCGRWEVKLDGKVVHTAETEDAAMMWIDVEKRKAAQNG